MRGIMSSAPKRKAVGNPIKLNVTKGKSGFTLLELLVVVGILAALVALALPFYQDYVNQSKLTAAEADLQTFKKALAMYDQLEPTVFKTTNDFRDLIGKYLQDYRKNTTQIVPIDPWGNDYQYNVAAGTVWSMGPNGINDSTTARMPSGDDIMITWKPDFFLASAKRVSNTVLELSFSRKVDWATLTVGSVTDGTVTGVGALQKISDTVGRVTFGGTLVGAGTVTVNASLAAQDGRLLSQSTKPDTSVANAVAF